MEHVVGASEQDMRSSSQEKLSSLSAQRSVQRSYLCLNFEIVGSIVTFLRNPGRLSLLGTTTSVSSSRTICTIDRWLQWIKVRTLEREFVPSSNKSFRIIKLDNLREKHKILILLQKCKINVICVKVSIVENDFWIRPRVAKGIVTSSLITSDHWSRSSSTEFLSDVSILVTYFTISEPWTKIELSIVDRNVLLILYFFEKNDSSHYLDESELRTDRFGYLMTLTLPSSLRRWDPTWR